MNILIIGSGGREHAMAWKVKQSSMCDALFVAPGNAGTAQIAVNLSVKPTDFEGIGKAVLENEIDFVIVGPDDPLGLGIVDYFRTNEQLKEIAILGPPAAGAKLEASKDFAKEFMQRHSIPTAAYRSFSREERREATAYLAEHKLPVVIKADGLAAGKGVSVCLTHEEARSFLDEIWTADKFGAAGNKVVVEEYLSGIELSAFILTDGRNYIMLPEAKDYKRIGEGDTGPNTGGMGSVSPVPFADSSFINKVQERIIEPTLKGLQEDDIPYRGFIFIGLMNVHGDPFVIEYNARMGDPETQTVFARIKSDIVQDMLAAAKGELKPGTLEVDPRVALAVIAVSEGYPETYQTGFIIEGLDLPTDSLIFHAGTRSLDDKLVTSGGRVLAVTAFGDTLEEARNKAYTDIGHIHFSRMSYRTDIGSDLLPKLIAQNSQREKLA